MKTCTDAPLPWSKVALAILPGLFALGSEVGTWKRMFHLDHEAAWKFDNWGLLFLCALLCAIGLARERRFETWSFPALGIMLAMASFGASSSFLALFVWLGMVVVILVE